LNNTFGQNILAINPGEPEYVKMNKYKIKNVFFFSSKLRCNTTTGKVNVTVEFTTTDNSTGVLNELLENLYEIANNYSVKVFIDDECDNGIGN